MTLSDRPDVICPALRGIMGDRVFYSCLMNFHDLAGRVSYAEEIHTNKGLSDMIQRRLDGGRGLEIANYIRSQNQRFFNSLVVATYGGSPQWHPLQDVTDNTQDASLAGLPQELIESVGFLTLGGDERLFALDGQHRLAGIKKAIQGDEAQDLSDDISVIFVSHQDTADGLERTRRLFTTLNKTAKSVSKGDIIALDEDDIVAVCVRKLVEETELLDGDRVAFTASSNMPTTNKESVTTIGNLYDVVKVLFTRSVSDLQKGAKQLRDVPTSESNVRLYFEYAKSYFELLGAEFKELGEFFDSDNTGDVVPQFRGQHGGKVIFRPLGLELLTATVCRLTNSVSLEEAVRTAAKLPRDLDAVPFVGLMWNPAGRTIIGGHKVTLREILCYMVGAGSRRYPDGELLKRYRRDTENAHASLPSKVV